MLTAGIIGLPNAGKSTLFNALTRSRQAPVASYPFCTIDPNVGVIEVPDERLDRLLPIYGAPKRVPAAIEFFDIAGLVRGASTGEGLGNRFLAHIREVDAIVEVVRCFEQPDVAHVDGDLDPVRDVETIRTELALADLETVARRKEKLERQARTGDRESRVATEVVERVEAALDRDRNAAGLELSAAERDVVDEMLLLTAKPLLYVANVAETDLAGGSAAAARLRDHVSAGGGEVLELCAELESQFADLDDDEAAEYRSAVGLGESATDRLIRAVYGLLGLITFFTGNDKEVRARAIPRGTTALAAAGRVHSDIERGFIGAEVIAFEELIREQSIHHAREDGRLRLEGKPYEVRDGDIILFRFHV